MNKQLYENSGLADLYAEEGVEPDAKFFNQKEPNLAVLHEKPEHRLILWLKARGYSNREVATATGYTEAWISQVTRQPWAQAQLLKFINEGGQDELQSLLEGAAADSVRKLINLRDDELVPPAVQRAACVDLLDRFLGKPTMRVETKQDVTVTTRTVEEIDRELAMIEAEEQRLRGNIQVVNN